MAAGVVLSMLGVVPGTAGVVPSMAGVVPSMPGMVPSKTTDLGADTAPIAPTSSVPQQFVGF